MPLDNLPDSDMPDPGNPLPRADVIRQQQMNELAEWHAMDYKTESPLNIARKFQEHNGHWPAHIYYPPGFEPVMNEAALAWLHERSIQVIIDAKANNWAWAGPRVHS